MRRARPNFVVRILSRLTHCPYAVTEDGFITFTFPMDELESPFGVLAYMNTRANANGACTLRGPKQSHTGRLLLACVACVACVTAKPFTANHAHAEPAERIRMLTCCGVLVVVQKSLRNTT